MPSSRGSSGPRDRTGVSCISYIGRWIFYHSTTDSGSTFLMNFQSRCWPGLQSYEGLDGDGRSPSKMLLLFSYSVMSDTLQLQRPQHASLPCPLLICSIHVPGICSSSCSLSRWTNHLILSPLTPALSLFQHHCLFQWVSSSHQVAKVLELQLQHQPSNEYSGLISFKTGWFDLLAVQRTLKRLLQYHSLKASILWLSAFFMVPLSHPYMTIGNIALTVQTFPRWLIHMTGK